MLHTSRRLQRFVQTRNVLPQLREKCKSKATFCPCDMQSKDSLEAHLTEHFRLSGVYWGLTALYLMGQLNAVDGAAIIDWVRSVSYGNCCACLCLLEAYCDTSLQVMRCQHASGGFGGSERNDPHLLYTLSALQVLALYDKLDRVNADQVVSCESSPVIPTCGHCSCNYI